MYIPDPIWIIMVSLITLLIGLYRVAYVERNAARKLAEKFKKELDERPIKTIIYGK